MNNFYKPSGKTSPTFFINLLLSIFFIVPVLSFLQSAVFRYSPVIAFTLVGAIICLFSVALLCGHLCVKKGKVRNKKLAVASALLTGLMFSFISLIFYCAFFENRLYPTGVAEFFTNSTHLLDSVKDVLNQGIVLSRRYTQSSVRIHGVLLIIMWGIGFLLTQIVIVVYYLILVNKPFIEKRKQWAKEINLEFDYIENKTDFINKMINGDPDYIIRLPVLQDVNTSYSSFELYPMENNYYLSVHNHKAKPANKNGNVKFEKHTLFEYLSIGEQAGDMLLSKQIRHNREQVNAKIVNKRTKGREGLSLLKSAVIAGLFFFCIIQAFRNGQISQLDFSASAVLFCSVVCVIYYTLCAVGSFTKEDVIVLEDTMFDEDWQPQDTLTNPYRIEQKDSGLFHKVFYLLMSGVSIGFLTYMIYFNWR